MKKLIARAALLLLVPMFASAQDADRQYHGQGYGFFGLGTSMSYSFYHPTVWQLGFGGEGFLYKVGLGAELGYVHWGANENQAWMPSGDVSYHFRGNRARARVDPFVLGGATMYAPTSHGARGAPAGNFGGGVNLWFQELAALRLEVRDHVSNNRSFGPGNHYLSFRVGITFRQDQGLAQAKAFGGRRSIAERSALGGSTIVTAAFT